MSKRVKSKDKPIIAVKDWKHADELIALMAGRQIKIGSAEAKAAKAIQDAKATLAKDVKLQQVKIDLYFRSLEAFAAQRTDEFGKARSKKLNFGKLGWRKSTKVKISNNKKTLELLKKVYEKVKAYTFIHVKESPDKDALGKLTDEQLATIGARRKITDDFFVEPDLPEAVDYNE